MTKISTDKQKAMCAKWGAEFLVAQPADKLGMASNVETGEVPVHGLRHWPSEGTSGWYIWSGGEPEAGDDFFLPIHVSHVSKVCPAIEDYLGLAPGWRFLFAPDYEDVWFDSSLLKYSG